MKITILQENLHKALNIVAKIASSSAQLPILNTVLISANKDGVTFSSTNLELSINYWTGAKVLKTGKLVVPIKQLLETVGSLPKDKIELAEDEHKLLISGRGVKAQINTMKSEEFPQIPTTKSIKSAKNILTFAKKELVDCVNKVSFAASIDESRAILTGVMLTIDNNIVKAVATDGYRLSLFNFSHKVKASDLSQDVIIPARALNELVRVLGEDDDKVTMRMDQKGNQAIFSFTNGEVVTRLIEGNYPDYAQILPSNEKQIKIMVNKDDLERAVKLASIFARDSANIIRFGINRAKLTVEANAAQLGKGSSELEINLKGANIKIAFNYRFISDVLKAINSSEVEIGLIDEQKPGVFFEKENKGFLHLVMPVRVQAAG